MIDKTAEPSASEWDNDDPGAAIRFAGCSVENELISLEVQVS